MNCEQWQLAIALDVEGDLPETEGVALREHLEICAGCRLFAEEMKASQETLHSLAEEGVPVMAVHARVMEQVAPRRRVGWLWGLAAVAVMAVLVLAGVRMVWRQEPVVPPPSVQIATVPPPAIAFTPPARPLFRAAVHHVRPVAASAPAQPLKIKMFTSDPNVVVYWLVDTKGENE